MLKYLLIALLIFTLGIKCAFAGKDFVMLYQFTKMKDNSDVIEQMMAPALPVRISYELRFGLKHHDTSQPIPSERILKITSERIKSETPAALKYFTIIDIETWKTGLDVDDITARESIKKYTKTMDGLKRWLPGYRIGNYGKPVHRDYRASISAKDSSLYKKWKSRNSLSKPLADALDVFCPSLYTFEPNKQKWRKFAQEHINESRRLATKKQPVIAFIWPQYHNRSRYKGQFLSYDYLRFQLETMFELADGVIIWSNHREDFNGKADWYRAVKDFMVDLKSRSVIINAFAGVK